MLREMREEMMSFRDSLAGMTSKELGYLMAMANHLRLKYESIGHRPFEALTYSDQNPEYLHQLFASIKKSQKTIFPVCKLRQLPWYGFTRPERESILNCGT